LDRPPSLICSGLLLNPKTFEKEVIFMASKQQKFEALKTAVEIAKEYARSAAEGYPTGVMKDSYKAIIAIIDEIENSDD
ncbi:MAG: hypothetical protein PVJ87_07820, partial [Desulfobacterales bacterium]